MPAPVVEIHSDLQALENDAALFAETNFASRAEALDRLEFGIIDRIEGLLQTTDSPDELLRLKQVAQRLQRRLEAVDAASFQRLRASIRQGGCTGAALRRVIEAAGGAKSTNLRPHAEAGYDNRDAFINGLLLTRPAPFATSAREPEMVIYQPTPARIILELVEKAQFAPQDIFYDLGSGLGQVSILANLLGGVAARGVEVEPAYCAYARECAAELNLARVEFIQADARGVDYAAGTVFYLYTPFTGAMLQDVLEKLRGDTEGRIIRLFTYGPCTAEVARQGWLARLDNNGDHLYKLGVFKSLRPPSDF